MMRKDISEHSKISDLTFLELFKKCVSDNVKHTETDLKLFCYLISRMQTKLHMLNNGDEDQVFLDGYAYLNDDEEERYTLYVKISSLISGATKSKFTIDKISEILYRLLSLGVIVEYESKKVIMPAFQKITVDEEENDITIQFNDEAMEYLINLKEEWIHIYSKELKELKGKIMIGLYFYYRKFRKTGLIKLKIDDAKSFFQCDTYTTIEFIRRLKGYVEKFNQKLGTDLHFETEKKGTKTSHIIIRFTPQKAINTID